MSRLNPPLRPKPPINMAHCTSPSQPKLPQPTPLHHLIQQSHRLGWPGDPGRGAGRTGLEVIRPGAEELVADVEGLLGRDPAKVALTAAYAPGFVL